MLRKNMKLGNSFYIFLYFLFIVSLQNHSYSEEKISTSPLINLDQIEPSFEQIEENVDNEPLNINIKKKERNITSFKSSHAILIGLDKITAKSSRIMVNIDQSKKFGPLEIRILRCGKIKINNKVEDVAYMQVKDLSKNENEKVFIYNGWTFSSDPSITPFDHAIYDLQLVNCFNT